MGWTSPAIAQSRKLSKLTRGQRFVSVAAVADDAEGGTTPTFPLKYENYLAITLFSPS